AQAGMLPVRYVAQRFEKPARQVPAGRQEAPRTLGRYCDGIVRILERRTPAGAYGEVPLGEPVEPPGDALARTEVLIVVRPDGVKLRDCRACGDNMSAQCPRWRPCLPGHPLAQVPGAALGHLHSRPVPGAGHGWDELEAGRARLRHPGVNLKKTLAT